MYPRKNYEMTEADLEELLEACNPVPMIALNCGTPSSPQENANRAWKALGDKMGFDSMSVEPAAGGYRFFTAIPNEPEEVKKEREAKEAEELKRKNIARLEAEIKEKQNQLSAILGVSND